jgi:hypothetical protein
MKDQYKETLDRIEEGTTTTEDAYYVAQSVGRLVTVVLVLSIAIAIMAGLMAIAILL